MRVAGRSIKVRQVFAELRRALGPEIPAVEVLRLAAALVDVAHPVEIHDEELGHSNHRPASDRVPLDHAFSDGGWRLMHREFKWLTAAYQDDDPAFAASRGRTKATFAA
jgi:hypothetical protein